MSHAMSVVGESYGAADDPPAPPQQVSGARSLVVMGLLLAAGQHGEAREQAQSRLEREGLRLWGQLSAGRGRVCALRIGGMDFGR